VAWSLAAGVFPSIHPNWNTGLIIGLSLAASFLFFASVLAHEFAHSLVARARVMPVSRITLFIFDGVSNIEKEPASPGSEFWMALGFPLDGGRVLRSILWKASGSVRIATSGASGVGQVIAWAFIVAGIAMAFGMQIPFFGTGLINGLWLAFIG
jgi:Zn-dependent protease